MKSKKLLPGKLPIRFLEKLLKRYTSKGYGVVVGPGIGIDAAVIKFGGKYLIAKTDPVTFVAGDIGIYAININANDIAAMGGRPKWFLSNILLPEKKTSPEMVEDLFSQIYNACKELGISFCGGHTEITFGIDRHIVIGQMLGEVKKGELVTAGGAKAGDDIILTKGIAIEATSILGREKGRELRKRFSARFIKRCKETIKSPGLSVLKDAHVALKYGRVHAMHDPTEGGVATGLHELAIASKAGVLIDRDAIPVLPECKRLCDYFGIDPLGAIASGALLICLAPRDTAKVIKGLGKERINAYMIGKVTHRAQGVKIREKGRIKRLPLFERDEITKVLK
ncbi:MAG: hydrogenase expression/formation protein [Nitrospirae bacterium]|nr:hydrogenase expression/formation protein [Nitrospirota bacterium]